MTAMKPPEKVIPHTHNHAGILSNACSSNIRLDGGDGGDGGGVGGIGGIGGVGGLGSIYDDHHHMLSQASGATIAIASSSCNAIALIRSRHASHR